MIRAAREVNDSKPGHVVAEIKQAIGDRKNAVVACLGITFKPEVDDLRGSPALEIVARLAEDNALSLLVVEPHVRELPGNLSALENVELVDKDEALRWADVVALLVNHRDFHSLDRSQLAGKAIVDTSGTWRAP